MNKEEAFRRFCNDPTDIEAAQVMGLIGGPPVDDPIEARLAELDALPDRDLGDQRDGVTGEQRSAARTRPFESPQIQALETRHRHERLGFRNPRLFTDSSTNMAISESRVLLGGS